MGISTKRSLVEALGSRAPGRPGGGESFEESPNGSAEGWSLDCSFGKE